jgi:PleD family two-component response regulator
LDYITRIISLSHNSMTALPALRRVMPSVSAGTPALKDHSRLRLFLLNCILAGTNTFHPGLGVRSRHLILVVEDELLLSLDISDALKDENYDVIAVANADEAIKALESLLRPTLLVAQRI